VRVSAVAALVLVLAACGGSSAKPLTAAQKRACTVRIFFSGTATRAEEHSVAAKLRSDARVARVSFASKAQALATMKKNYPNLTSSIPSNPLPDSYTAVPGQLDDLAGLAHSVTAAHWPGVETVYWGSILRSLCGGGGSR